jgi:hypothetical protein
MPTPKAGRTSAARKTSNAATTPPRAPAGASLRFWLSEDLQGRLTGILAIIETAGEASRHHTELSETIIEVTNEGLDYYFMRSLRLARAGFIVEQSASLGLVGVRRVMAPVIRKIVGRLTHDQLRSVASSIRELMT